MQQILLHAAGPLQQPTGNVSYFSKFTQTHLTPGNTPGRPAETSFWPFQHLHLWPGWDLRFLGESFTAVRNILSFCSLLGHDPAVPTSEQRVRLDINPVDGTLLCYGGPKGTQMRERGQIKLLYTSQTCKPVESEHYLKKIGFVELGGIQLYTVALPFRFVLAWVTAPCGFPEHYQLITKKNPSKSVPVLM